MIFFLENILAKPRKFRYNAILYGQLSHVKFQANNIQIFKITIFKITY